MRVLSAAAALVIVAVAAFITLSTAASPFEIPQFVSAVVLTLAAALQRLGTVMRLVGTDNKRDNQLNALSEQTLNRLVRGRRVRDETYTLVVHIWEVPTWYRRLLPFGLRHWTSARVKGKKLARLVLRPTLRRSAAVALKKPVRTGIRFVKGSAIVGVCVERCDPTSVMRLDTSTSDYERALSAGAASWASEPLSLTHGLDYDAAQTLATKYGQVMARVVQDPNTGEAIGCATVSVCRNDVAELQIFEKSYFERELHSLADAVGPLLALK